jgi:glycosyltransferase involved in cell wall biosynthesis
MKILIFDVEITGHHPEYISHLVSHISESGCNGHSYFFVVHPDFCNRFPEITGQIAKSEITFVTISKNELNSIYVTRKNSLKQFISPFKIYALLKKYANSIKPELSILMYFNYFLIPLIIKRPGFKVTGILFSPFLRIQHRNNFFSTFNYFRKQILTYLYTRNNAVQQVFILNDQTVVETLNKQYKKEVFKYLPDPVPEIEEENIDIKRSYKIEYFKKIYLHFGSLRDSKSTIEIIQSFNLLPETAQKKCCLILAGQPYNDVFEKRIEQVISQLNGVSIIYIKKFVSKGFMKSLFNQSDLILMPYKNALASSGVIGHAIASGKPVIATKQGLIGEILSNNWKGELIDEIKPETIAKAIEISIEKNYPEIENSRFLDEHTPANFARTILN